MGRREGSQAGLERRDDSADSQSAPGYASEVLDQILSREMERWAGCEGMSVDDVAVNFLYVVK
jgi:hypothetical protein